MFLRDTSPSRRFRLGAAGIVLLLAPLVYWLASYFVSQVDPHTRTEFSVYRTDIETRAWEYAVARGLPRYSWDFFATAESNDNLRRYLERQDGAEGGKARRLAPATTIRALLLSPDRDQSFEAWFTVDGEPLGFRTLGWTPNKQESSERNTEDIAKDAMDTLLARAASDFRVERLRHTEGSSLQITEGDRFDWRLTTPSLPDFSLICLVVVKNGSVILLRIQPDFAQGSSWFAKVPAVVPRTSLVAGLMFLLLVLDTLFFRKIREREISGVRTTVMTLFLLALFVAAGEVFSDRWRFDLAEILPLLGEKISRAYYRPLGYALAFVFSLILGLAWSRCESDVRESFPKKLTPLDAIFSGKIFTHNVGQAFVLGAALAVWAVALKSIVWMPWVHQPGAGPGLDELEVFMARNPALSALCLPLTKAVSHTLLGLLMPLSLLGHLSLLKDFPRISRFSQRHKIWILALVLVLYFTLNAMLSAAPDSPFPGLVLKAAVNSAVLLVPFILFDVLVVFFTVLVSRVYLLIIYLSHQPNEYLENASWQAWGLALITFIIASWLTFLTRRVTDQEVRPVYAVNLEERLKLQSRVAAAHEAQRSMMPTSERKLLGGSVASSNRSVYQYGGDYHDFFELPEGKLGIVLAEFDGQPLAATVAIPLLKGFLIPYTRRYTEPRQVLLELDQRLGIQPNAFRSIAFLVVDPSRRTLEHARLGAEPPIVLRDEASSKTARLRSPNARSAPAAVEQLAAGDTLLLSTPRTVAQFSEGDWEADLSLCLRMAVRLSPGRKARWILRWARALVAPPGTLITLSWNRPKDSP